MRSSTLLCVLTLATPAHADANPPSSPGPAVPAQRSARHTDAHADRIMLAPTAETHPAGTVYASAYEVVLWQVGYAFSDRFQGEIATIPFVLNEAAFADLAFKASLLRSRWLRVAVVTAIDYLHVVNAQNDDGEEGPRDIVAGRVGPTLQLCFDLRCTSSLSASAVGVAQAETEIVWPLAFSAGFTARLGEDLSLLLEYSTMHNIGQDAGLIGLPLYTVGYALRIATADDWALDLGFVRELASDEQLRFGTVKFIDVVGLPVGVFTYRWLP